MRAMRRSWQLSIDLDVMFLYVLVAETAADMLRHSSEGTFRSSMIIESMIIGCHLRSSDIHVWINNDQGRI